MSETMVKIESDGTPFGTCVVDLETGKSIKNIRAIDIHIGVEGIEAKMEIIAPEIKVVAKAEKKTVSPS